MKYATDRRLFLKLSGSTLLLLGTTPLRVAASSARKEPVLVVLFQRGAADALHLVSPYRDRHYRELRGALALDEPGRGESPTLDLGDGFAFHPALSSLYPLYQSGTLAPIVNVGSPDETRSHFDAQDYMESGTPGVKSTRDGWLSRVAGALDDGASPFAAVSVTSQMPRSLWGAPDAIAMDDFSKLGFGPETDLVTRQIEARYSRDENDAFSDAGDEAFRALRMFREADPLSKPARPGVSYPGSRGRRSRNPLEQLAKLIKADLGVRVAFVESGGWDTHFAQGAATGQMANLMRDLGGSVAAFFQDVSDDVPVTLLVATEFGRTVAPNGAGGTDHGHGSVMLVAGDGVEGGKVRGDWLGLDRKNLYEGRDLPVTTDFRDVFSEVASTSVGVTTELFPGYGPRSIGLMNRG